MGVFDIPEKTPQEIAADIKRRINIGNLTSLRDLKKRAEDAFNLFWQPPEGVTTQMICDEYGTDAAALFQLNSQVFTFICSLDSTYEPPEPGAYTINEDGTVTIG